MPRFDLDPDQLRAYRPDVVEPADFDEFWRATLADARRHPMAPTIRPAATPLRAVDAFDVTFTGFGGESIAAWLLLPKHGGALPAVVEFVGYGGGRGLAHERLHWVAAGYAHLVVDTRGQGSAWGTGGGTADPHGSGPSVPGFMTRGIERPEDYYYRRVFTDAVRAVDFIRGLDRVDPARVAVAGTSQGGGIALAVAGLVPGLAAVMPDVPFLCDFPRAVGLTARDPYAEIERYLAVHRGAEQRVLRTLGYFDGVHFARRATAPSLFSVALMDQTCPPSTVYAAHNHYAGESWIVEYTHNDHEGGAGQQWLEQVAWLESR